MSVCPWFVFVVSLWCVCLSSHNPFFCCVLMMGADSVLTCADGRTGSRWLANAREENWISVQVCAEKILAEAITAAREAQTGRFCESSTTFRRRVTEKEKGLESQRQRSEICCSRWSKDSREREKKRRRSRGENQSGEGERERRWKDGG